MSFERRESREVTRLVLCALIDVDEIVSDASERV